MRKRPLTTPDQPAYPRREEHVLARRRLLALIGGAASLSLVGCDRDDVAETEPITAADDRAKTAQDDRPVATSSTQAVGGPTPDESAGALEPVTRRLPPKGPRSLSLSRYETIHYAVTIVHPDPRFGAYADANQTKLLGAADAGIRAVPPHQWRNAAARAKTEAAILANLQALLSKEGRIGAPFASVQLDVQSIVKRPRRTAGVPPRHDSSLPL